MTLAKREHTEQQGDKEKATAVGDAAKWAEEYIEETSEFQLVGLMERARKKHHPHGSPNQMMHSADTWATSFAQCAVLCTAIAARLPYMWTHVIDGLQPEDFHRERARTPS